MELYNALKMFHIDHCKSTDQLNSIFRDLVKKYHPDKVRGYPEWANQRMIEINDAYATLVTQLQIESETDSHAQSYENKNEDLNVEEFEDDSENRYSLAGKELKKFDDCFNQFLEGLGKYYQYGLQNAAHRFEGVRRFRFRESIRIIEKSSNIINQLCEEVNNQSCNTLSDFIRCTIADISFDYAVFPDRAKYRHQDFLFRTARKNFDEAIREILFPELVQSHLRGTASSKLYSSYPIFVYYFTTFKHSTRGEAGMILTERHHAITDLLTLREIGEIDF